MDLVNVAHLHLLLNHFPTIGTVVGLGLLLLAFARRNDHLVRASLEVFFLIALLTLPAYLTGVAAQTVVQGRAGVSDAAITAHQNAALLAFLLMEVTGALAWFGLWQSRRNSRPGRSTLGTVLLLSVVTVVLMGRAATYGGEISHPEIRISADAPPVEDALAVGTRWLGTASISGAVAAYPWVWPAAECLHFIGLCLVFGLLLTVNLRLLGFMRGLSFASLHRLLPWGIMAFAVNLMTGMLFVISAPEQYTENGPFYWKVALLGLAGVNFLYLTVFDKNWALREGDEPRPLDRALAGAAIMLWVGVIYAGRMLPFIGNAF
ncbi:MAG TPA: hypothetical protein VIX63_05700 [Vicinamibacterales bacterium]